MQIYISNLKNDITAKLEEKEYDVKDIEVQIENDETYKIKNIELFLVKKEKQEEKKTYERNVIINEIETVKIQIGTQKQDKNIVEIKKLK